MGSRWVNVKSERQACRLEPQAGADPAVLRQNFFLLQEASGLAPPAFDWLDEATTVLRVISSTEVLMTDVNHNHNIPSQQHLDQCLIESPETGLAKLTQKTDHRSTCQDIFLKKKSPHWYYCILQPTWICIEKNSVSKISQAFWRCMYTRERF